MVQFRPRVTVVVVLGPALAMSLCCRPVSGAARHPAWYFNLVAHPEVRVEVGHDAYSAIVRVATGEERARLWDYVMETAPPIAAISGLRARSRWWCCSAPRELSR